jgi:hypothetical protein
LPSVLGPTAPLLSLLTAGRSLVVRYKDLEYNIHIRLLRNVDWSLIKHIVSYALYYALVNIFNLKCLPYQNTFVCNIQAHIWNDILILYAEYERNMIKFKYTISGSVFR